MKVSELSDSLDHIAHRALNETSITLIDPPAVLIVVRGMILARTFPVAVTTRPVTINQDMKALIPYPTLDAWFLSCLLAGLEHHILTCVEESGHGTRCLRSEVWQNMTVPVPPYREQREIVESLDLEFTSMNTAIDRTRREIDLLREYRTRLIADVVTGKLDVRGVELPAPDEAEAQDDFDIGEDFEAEEMDHSEETEMASQEDEA